MAVFDPSKTLDRSEMKCGDIATLTLKFKASAELINKPSDIVLIIDRSDSMKGERFEYAKEGVFLFLKHILDASGGQERLQNSTRIGLITFGFDATIDSQFTDDVNYLKKLINDIIIPERSKTNHAAAFKLALTMFSKNPIKDQVILIFTDGETTYGEEPNTYATRLKKMGVEIFCIGLVDKATSLRAWASKPISDHALTTRDPIKLLELFNRISYEIAKSGARDVIIDEKVNQYFEITEIFKPNFGTISKIDSRTIRWNIDAFGIDEEAVCTFKIKYIGSITGNINVNESIEYKDRDNNKLDFPNPKVHVECSIKPDIIDKGTEKFTVNSCDGLIIYKTLDKKVDGLGRIFQFNLKIKNVCPNKKLALGVILTEIDQNGIEHMRGSKKILIDCLEHTHCKDIIIKCINFVLPEKVLGINENVDICTNRNFKLRVITNYMDSNYTCCDIDNIILK